MDFPPKHPANRQNRIFMWLPWAVATAVAILGLGVWSMVRIFRVPTDGMAPTIEKSSLVVATRWLPRFQTLRHGDVVAFTLAGIEGSTSEVMLAKRIIGLPGDTIRVEAGSILLNGAPPREPGTPPIDYRINGKTPTQPRNGSLLTVPPGEAYVLGDNPSDSLDSRFFGPIPIANIRWILHP